MEHIKPLPGPNSQEQRVLGECTIHPKQGGVPDMTGLKTVLELGNKRKPRNGLPYRGFYTSLGMTYTSLDWNGEDGSVKRDLNKIVEVESIDGPFDLVTNFGTTEHVSDQQTCWQNVHNFVKVGGKLACQTPIGPNWEQHGFWHPSLEWYQEFADLNGYTVERLETEQYGGRDFRKVTCARLRKTQNLSFAMPLTPIARSPKNFNQENQYSV